MIVFGMPTVRLPARDFGGPMTSWLVVSMYWRRMLTERASRSISQRRRATASPHRRLAKVASRTSARNRRSFMRSARSNT